MFEAKVDDISYWVIENTGPAEFKNVKIFVADNWFNPASGKIRNLKVQTKRDENILFQMCI